MKTDPVIMARLKVWSEIEVVWTENITEWKQCFKFIRVSVIGDLESVKRWKKHIKKLYSLILLLSLSPY